MNNGTDNGGSGGDVSSAIDSSATTQCFQLSTLETVSSRAAQQVLMFLYCCISLLSLVGNVAVIVVQVWGRAEATAPGIRRYLINLAVTDIIIGVLSVPFTYTDFVLRQWIFPHWLCPTAQIVQLLCVFITSISLTIIGIERYFATLHPMSRSLRWLQSHTNWMIGLTWVVGLVYAYVPLRHTATRAFDLGDGQVFYQCSYDNGLSVQKRRLYLAINFVFTFALPSVIMTAAYVAIMRRVRHSERQITNHSVGSSGGGGGGGGGGASHSHSHSHHNSSHNSNSFTSSSDHNGTTTNAATNTTQIRSLVNLNGTNGGGGGGGGGGQQSQALIRPNENIGRTRPPPIQRQITTQSLIVRRTRVMQNRTKTIKIMFVIIIVYDICWFPLKLYQFLLGFDLISFCTEFQFYLWVYTYIACHWLAMANSFVNPIVYSFMSSAFRSDFRKIRKLIYRSPRSLQREFSLNMANNNNNNHRNFANRSL